MQACSWRTRSTRTNRSNRHANVWRSMVFSMRRWQVLFRHGSNFTMNLKDNMIHGFRHRVIRFLQHLPGVAHHAKIVGVIVSQAPAFTLNSRQQDWQTPIGNDKDASRNAGLGTYAKRRVLAKKHGPPEPMGCDAGDDDTVSEAVSLCPSTWRPTTPASFAVGR